MGESPVPDYAKQEGYLYSVLNVSKAASQAEINERHRALSLIFHPDKQQDEQLKATSTKEFLEIQKAYQVLSDPFLRQVYDSLGSEGLRLQWLPEMRLKPNDEIKAIIEETKPFLQRRKMEESIIPRGKMVCSVDASSLFAPKSSPDYQNFARSARERLGKMHVIAQTLSYTAKKRINDKTSASLEVRSNLQGKTGSMLYLGTVRHQFSPRLVTLTTLNLRFPYTTHLDLNYDDPNNALTFKTIFLPLAPAKLPETTLVLSRKLLRSKRYRGQLSLHVGRQGSAAFFLTSPGTLNLSPGESLESTLRTPTTSGLQYVSFDKSIGIAFDSILPKLIAEASLTFAELATQLKCSLQWGLGTGLLGTLGCQWSNGSYEAGSNLILAPSGIVWEFDFAYLEQRLSLPIVLSSQFSQFLALGTIVVPSTAALIGYRFIVVPRRRARRIAHLRAAKKVLEEDLDTRKERSVIEALLRDAVRKQIRLETGREGLVIREATYGASEADEESQNLWLDVTIPMQALVRNSQLHIPGGDTKAALQGFSDPAPFASKSLRIHYLFRGCVHYAEIPDYMPVVLPLAEHRVDDLS
ncbi:hypothetical protein B0H34DRAFT_711623 [Crassisporium funariophilum]|nr:hypothetical protein B0H34DRAFT_711623 [Crassisporium funariophilum]